MRMGSWIGCWLRLSGYVMCVNFRGVRHRGNPARCLPRTYGAGGGVARAARTRLPMNRKERFFTGTVLPGIVAGDGLQYLHLLASLCRIDVVCHPVVTNRSAARRTLKSLRSTPSRNRFVLTTPLDSPTHRWKPTPRRCHLRTRLATGHRGQVLPPPRPHDRWMPRCAASRHSSLTGANLCVSPHPREGRRRTPWTAQGESKGDQCDRNEKD